MKKSTLILNATWMSAILLSTLSVYGMESNFSFAQWASQLLTSNTQLALQAEQYNNNNSIVTTLPQEILIHIFSFCLFTEDKNQVISAEIPLKNSIKNFMKLCLTNKRFNALLTPETIGNFCKNYDTLSKNHVWKNTACSSYNSIWFILMYAGVDKANELLTRAVMDSNTQLIERLFKINPNLSMISRGDYPSFFYAKTVAIAQIFVDHNIKLGSYKDFIGNNVLCHIFQDGYSSELINFYLQNGVYVKKSDYGSNTLLHIFAECKGRTDVIGSLEKGKILLNVFPYMINELNKYKQTPLDIILDIIQANSNQEKFFPSSSSSSSDISPYLGCSLMEDLTEDQTLSAAELKVFEELKTLFRDLDGLTAQELEWQKAESKQERDNCIIC